MAAKVYGIIGTNKAMKEVIPKDNIVEITGTLTNVNKGETVIKQIDLPEDIYLNNYAVIAVEQSFWFQQYYNSNILHKDGKLYPIAKKYEDRLTIEVVHDGKSNNSRDDINYRIILLKIR